VKTKMNCRTSRIDYTSRTRSKGTDMVLDWHSRSRSNNKVSWQITSHALEVRCSQKSTNGFGAITASQQYLLYMVPGGTCAAERGTALNGLKCAKMTRLMYNHQQCNQMVDCTANESAPFLDLPQAWPEASMAIRPEVKSRQCVPVASILPLSQRLHPRYT
jgi:hypothetical protein